VRAGLFMAQQEKVLACGPSFAGLGLVLKFALGPAAMAIGSIAVGLRGDVLRVAIIQVPSSDRNTSHSMYLLYAPCFRVLIHAMEYH
jgi:auxin efflux carrier family protein